jgi:ABC-type sugar transport system permease subunit
MSTVTVATPVIKRKSSGSKARQQSWDYIYLVPAFIIMTIITFYPLIYQVVISFTDFQTKDLRLGLSSPQLHIIGFKNYIDILTSGLPVQNFNFFRVLPITFGGRLQMLWFMFRRVS